MSNAKKLGALVLFSMALGLVITWLAGGTSDDQAATPTTMAPATTTAPPTTGPTTTAAPPTTERSPTASTTTTAPPTTTTTLPPARQLSVLQLVVGDCVADELAAADDISEVGVVDCDQPHQSEVYEVITDPAADSAPWPGPDVFVEISASGCLAAFAPYVGQAFETSALDILTVLPTAETWAQGDRDILCVAARLDGDELTGSVEGSGL